MSQELRTEPDEPASGRVAADRKGLHSRRALVAGVMGAGVGAVAATVFAGAQPAWAEGENVTVGGSFPDATSTTSISTSSGTGLAGTTSDSSGAGVSGLDTSSGGGAGVSGSSTNGTGVSGSSSNSTGVQGSTSGIGQAGVAGEDTSSGGGAGVSGSSTNGIGVQAASSGGTALAVTGKVTFSSSGQ